MGKELIIKGADFSANGIVIRSQELIYDSISNTTTLDGWNSTGATAVSVPANANINGRTLTKIAIKRTNTCLQNIGIVKYNKITEAYTLLATITAEEFNASEITEKSLDNVVISSDELLMVGNVANGGDSAGMFFAVATGNQSTNFGRYTLLKTGVLNDISYVSAIMCKIWAWSE